MLLSKGLMVVAPEWVCGKSKVGLCGSVVGLKWVCGVSVVGLKWVCGVSVVGLKWVCGVSVVARWWTGRYLCFALLW
uniref:Uncharacterized protein n=2 Tax=Knipowitschia caucasica TaxID=637954 RepID=A0AAV2KNI7_KNICA